MPDTDVDEAQRSVDEQARWGETHDSRAIARILRWAKRTHDRLDTVVAAVQDLRTRVKALEDKTP
jgi:hypothetical protein